MLQVLQTINLALQMLEGGIFLLSQIVKVTLLRVFAKGLIPLFNYEFGIAEDSEVGYGDL